MARDHSGGTGSTVKDRVTDVGAPGAPDSGTERRFGYRWTICALRGFARRTWAPSGQRTTSKSSRVASSSG